MINTNIKNSHIRIENLYKSIFTEIDNMSIDSQNDYVEIKHKDDSNSDAASLELMEKNCIYILRYWDGYSLAEVIEDQDLNKALKNFKRLAKKMARNLTKYSSHL